MKFEPMLVLARLLANRTVRLLAGQVIEIVADLQCLLPEQCVYCCRHSRGTCHVPPTWSNMDQQNNDIQKNIQLQLRLLIRNKQNE